MKDKKLKDLLNKYSDLENKAQETYYKIIDELSKRKLLNDDILSCMNITETDEWINIILEVIQTK